MGDAEHALQLRALDHLTVRASRDSTSGSGSARRGDSAADRLRGCTHPVVVGHEAVEVAAKLTRGGEVNRIERAKLGRRQRS